MAETQEPSASVEIEQVRFRRFLALLMYDAETAGQKYYEIWTLLTMMFRVRGHRQSPEDLADEAMDLLLEKSEQILIENFRAFARGMARKISSGEWKTVKREAVKRELWQHALRNADKAERIAVQKEAMDDEKDDANGPDSPCFQSCLAKLSAEKRRALLGFYDAADDEGDAKRARKKLAVELRISEGALRKRVFDLRGWLEQCLADCQKSSGNESADGTI